jgi:hypothetical protein
MRVGDEPFAYSAALHDADDPRGKPASANISDESGAGERASRQA